MPPYKINLETINPEATQNPTYVLKETLNWTSYSNYSMEDAIRGISQSGRWTLTVPNKMDKKKLQAIIDLLNSEEHHA